MEILFLSTSTSSQVFQVLYLETIDTARTSGRDSGWSKDVLWIVLPVGSHSDKTRALLEDPLAFVDQVLPCGGPQSGSLTADESPHLVWVGNSVPRKLHFFPLLLGH